MWKVVGYVQLHISSIWADEVGGGIVVLCRYVMPAGKNAIIAIIVSLVGCWPVANLVVRNLDPRIVDALKQRAAKHGRSAEAEHRALLEELLLRPKGKSFAEVLAGMPNVGEDADFVRVDDAAEPDRVFD